ncbi:MAG: tRNA dihydrouridine synthase DusB [Gammaproteobacteria bacterium]|nr:MAG: tRNA dihydrouridine synthase DusB [Gammaproteobacteria bacterium]
MLRIGPHNLRNPIVLAPMAGVTDLPFRELAWELGAGAVVTEMTSAKPELWDTALSRERRAMPRDAGPRIIQVAGSDAPMIGDAVRRAEQSGAEIVDINMGCPAKKVCRQLAGSALLADEALVGRILDAAVRATSLPVTLKMRTGSTPQQRNGVRIARLAEAAGVASLAVHGRTRSCRFVGRVEYQTIAEIKRAVSVPVFANGDIDSYASAVAVLRCTGADGLLIGRAALGAPWLPGDIAIGLAMGRAPVARGPVEVLGIAARHLQRLHEFYGERRALGIARKHVKSYLERLGLSRVRIQAFTRLETAVAQHDFVARLLTTPMAARVPASREDEAA